MEETEDDAQRSARSEVVSPDELPSRSTDASASSTVSDPGPQGGASDAGSSSGAPAPGGSEGERADRPPSRGDAAGRPSADDDARSGAGAGGSPPGDGTVASEPSGESPDLDELREELNSQFESIKGVDPGKYELKLRELYDREEYIISLQEDGRYVIEVPESWRGDADQD
jgi:predicted  nucleic acid-binding Zn-ribbon protein